MLVYRLSEKPRGFVALGRLLFVVMPVPIHTWDRRNGTCGLFECAVVVDCLDDDGWCWATGRSAELLEI